MTAGPPQPGAVEVPAQVAMLAEGGPVRAVWRNELGGTTFAVGGPPARRFVKWSPTGCGIDLDREAARLCWAASFTPVPRVLGHGSDPAGSWLMTAALPGETAVSPRWRADPAAAVAAIGEGLRALHEALPVERCPFSWSVEARQADIAGRAAAGRLDPADWHEEHRQLTVGDALAAAAVAPPVDRLVVCHGDSCAPNTLLSAGRDPAGASIVGCELAPGEPFGTPRCRWTGHVDLGGLGVADRWADLAVATWSTAWNYGPGWQGCLLDAYGIGPDPERTRYYRLLWDLGP